MRNRSTSRLTITAALALVALVSLLYLTGGGYIVGEMTTYEGDTAPGAAGLRWVHKFTREVADYDTTHARYLASPVSWSVDRNSTSFTSDFLRSGGNGIPMDTAGVSAGFVSAGIPVIYDSRVTGLEGIVSGGAAASCTLRFWRTIIAEQAAEKLFEMVFTAPNVYAWPETTFAVTGSSVLSVSMQTSAAVQNPHFRFRLCREDTIP